MTGDLGGIFSVKGAEIDEEAFDEVDAGFALEGPLAPRAADLIDARLMFGEDPTLPEVDDDEIEAAAEFDVVLPFFVDEVEATLAVERLSGFDGVFFEVLFLFGGPTFTGVEV